MHEKYVTDYERATQWRDIHNRMQAQRSLRTDDTQLTKAPQGRDYL